MKAIEKYTETINYYNQCNYQNQVNFIWENNIHSDIARIISESKTEEELIDKVDRTFMYSINFPPENAHCNGQDSGCWTQDADNSYIRDKQIDWLLSKLTFNLATMPDNIQESRFIHEKNKTVRDNRVLSGNFLRTLSISQQIFKHIIGIESIIELGGGTGHQARTFLLQIPNCKYTIIDLPETMIFSFTYLNLNFPEKKLFWVASHEDLKYVDEYDIVFIPAMFADNLAGRSYDLFINTASMGEMRNDVIAGWMNFIQNQVNIKFLFTLNRFLNTVDYGLSLTRRNENECSVTYDTDWNILNWELEPIYCRCPYIDTLHSRYLEIIAKREKNDKDCIQESNKWLEDAKSEDIFRMANMYNMGKMQQRNNWLNNDTTMTGPLFKLWNSIRYHKNKENVSLMLTYLKRVTVCDFFEEYYYYEKILGELSSSTLV